MSHTVVFPDAVPPDTPITKGCLAVGEARPLAAAVVAAAAAAAEASAVPLQVAVEGEEGRDEEAERRRESRRSPLKWAPTADSSTSSIAVAWFVAGVLSWRSVFGEVGGFDTGMGRVLGGGGGGEEQNRVRLRGAGLRTPVS